MLRAQLDPERGFLNKWEMYKALNGEPIGSCHLPETAELNQTGIERMTAQYEALYIKPVDTWGGKGVGRVERHSNGSFVWMLQGEAAQSFLSTADLYAALQQTYQDQHCIVQQAAPILDWDGRAFDIRLHMQRDLDKEWKASGWLVRVSGTSAIVSNVAITGGHVITLEQALAKLFGYKQRKTKHFIKKLCNVGKQICHVLEPYREFYEIGIDLGVDPNGELWVIEVNTDDAICGPSHELFAQLPDKTMFTRIQQIYNRRQLESTRMVFELMVSMDETNT